MLCSLSEWQEDSAEDIFEKEILDVCKLETYMKLWQLVAAATCLNVRIMSVYPPKRQSCGRFLDRVIEPLPAVQQSNSNSKCTIIILWASTRDDMSEEYWVANHVEPIIQLSEPIDIVDAE
ncbi:hypothetical protein PoB_000845600 [Plakobranchus ocellatus]|uniref:Uncharacterized protein n=1 Tax=Plakobranchus ocellatus TaxID=259542 RepID=A0AAV3Y3X9_9GAST|nr:hypothetical protein PoB_000845600 [Plakobranchus ocellatus]